MNPVPKYDVESLLNDLKAIVVNNINTQLALIDVEKNDGVTMGEIDDNAYFFQSLQMSTAANYPVFVFYGIDDPVTSGIGHATSKAIDVFFIVVLQDTAENAVYMTRLLRYGRAMEEIFEKNFATITRAARLLVSSLAPVSFAVLNTPGSYKGVGVKIKATITS